MSAVRRAVLSTVSLNDELGSERDEVDDVTANRRLPPDVKAEGLQFAQLYPQFDFLWGETFTKCAGIFVCQSSPPTDRSHIFICEGLSASGRTLVALACGRDE